MDLKSKYLIGVMVILILISVALTYKKSFIDTDFEILTEEENIE